MSSLWFRFYYFLRTHKHSLKIFNGCTFQCLGGLENTPRKYLYSFAPKFLANMYLKYYYFLCDNKKNICAYKYHHNVC